MKKLPLFLILILLIFSLCACASQNTHGQIVATTLPVYEFTAVLCEGTNLSVSQLVTESVSCLHDYSLQVRQMKMIEEAEVIVISGAGLEAFLEEALDEVSVIIDASENAHIHEANEVHNHEEEHGHSHDHDPHIWLSPENAKHMAESICNGLSKQYPGFASQFEANLSALLTRLEDLHQYAEKALTSLSSRELITFHDGFAYLAECYDLTILRTIEEESGSEASADELKELILLVRENELPAVFIEKTGSASAANVIAAETGVGIYPLDMAISGESYFDAMYQNINTIKEALE